MKGPGQRGETEAMEKSFCLGKDFFVEAGFSPLKNVKEEKA